MIPHGVDAAVPGAVHGQVGRLGLGPHAAGPRRHPQCFAGGACAVTPSCRLKRALGEALAAFLAVLDGATLADLLGGEAGPDLARLLGIPGTEATDARAEVGG